MVIGGKHNNKRQTIKLVTRFDSYRKFGGFYHGGYANR